MSLHRGTQPRSPPGIAGAGAVGRSDSESKRAALTIASLFVVIGAVWLLLPDALQASGANAAAERMHLLRDALFLVVVAVLLYVVIRRSLATALADAERAPPAMSASPSRPGEESGPRLEALGRVTAGMAHDLNNVLAAITGYADLALRHLPAKDPSTPDLLAIRRTAERGASLARSVLALGRESPARPTVLDLNAVLVDAGRVLPRLAGPSISVSVEPAPRPAPVLADLSQLEQVLFNLVLNARDAMPEGGRLALRASIRPATTGAAAQVQLEVSDTGHGMDEATRARIFEPFFTTRESGTGLGLASVAQALQAAGGTVQCESTPGRGTTFRLVLPLIEERAPVALPAAETLGKPSATVLEPPPLAATVLVVDDDAALCDVLARMLVEGGHEARIARDGRQALLAAATGPVDVVVCDMLMPEKEGLETISELRQRRPALPIIAMSGALRGESYTGMALKLGAVGSLRKPFAQRELLDAVARALTTPVPPLGATPHEETERV